MRCKLHNGMGRRARVRGHSLYCWALVGAYSRRRCPAAGHGQEDGAHPRTWAVSGGTCSPAHTSSLPNTQQLHQAHNQHCARPSLPEPAPSRWVCHSTEQPGPPEWLFGRVQDAGGHGAGSRPDGAHRRPNVLVLARSAVGQKGRESLPGRHSGRGLRTKGHTLKARLQTKRVGGLGLEEVHDWWSATLFRDVLPAHLHHGRPEDGPRTSRSRGRIAVGWNLPPGVMPPPSGLSGSIRNCTARGRRGEKAVDSERGGAA